MVIAMDNIYESMTRAELEHALAELTADREDEADLRDTVLSQEGQHISSKNIDRFARRIAEIDAKISIINALLAQS